MQPEKNQDVSNLDKEPVNTNHTFKVKADGDHKQKPQSAWSALRSAFNTQASA